MTTDRFQGMKKVLDDAGFTTHLTKDGYVLYFYFEGTDVEAFEQVAPLFDYPVEVFTGGINYKVIQPEVI